MNLTDLEAFYRAAEAQSFLHSGVNLSPSAVGRKISKLERDLDVKLFHRHQNSVSLTDEGLLFYERAKKIIAEVEASRGDFDKEGEFSGKVTIYAPTTWNNIFLMQYCKVFMEKYPNACLEVHGSDTTPRFNAISPQIGVYYSIPESKELMHECIGGYNLKLYASKEYIKKYGEPKTLEDLDNHKLLAYSAATLGATKFLWHLEVGKHRGERRHAFFYLENVVTALLEGMGIATINEAHPAIKNSNLVNVLPDIVGPKIKIYLIHHKLHKNNRSIKLFRDLLVEEMRL